MAYPKTDFHCHTTASDGSLSPDELLQLAHEYEVMRLAITDHDTTRGYELARNSTFLGDIDLYPGVEISCNWRDQTIHIVGLNMDITNQTLQEGLALIRQIRRERAHSMCEKLLVRPNQFVQEVATEIQQRMEDPDFVVGRGHFAQLMIEKGLVKNMQQAFDRFLKRGRVGYVKVAFPELAEVVQWISKAGGVAVLAHPKSYPLSNNKLNALIQDFIDAGGKSIEVITKPRMCSEQTGLKDKAKRYGLHASLGSDFHHRHHHWRGLGWLAEMPEDCQPVWELFAASPAEKSL